MSREKSRVGGGGGYGKGDAIVRVGERKGELFFFRPSPADCLTIDFFRFVY